MDVLTLRTSKQFYSIFYDILEIDILRNSSHIFLGVLKNAFEGFGVLHSNTKGAITICILRYVFSGLPHS